MRKRMTLWISLILAAAVLAGCSARQTQEAIPAASQETLAVEVGAAPETEAVQEEPAAPTAETPAETEAPQVTEGPAMVPEPTAALMKATVARQYECAQDPANNFMIYEVTAPRAEIEGGDPALNASLEKVYQYELANVMSRRPEFYETYVSTGKTGGFYCTDCTDAVVCRADTSVVSLRTETQWFGGGAHGQLLLGGYVFRASDGQLLSAADVFTDPQELFEVLKRKLTAAYPDAGFYGLDESFASYDAAALPTDPEKVHLSFLLNSEGAVFFFNEYELAPYASGIQKIMIPYSEMPHLFRSEYMVASPDWFEPVEQEMPLLCGGREMQFGVGYSESGLIRSIRITCDGKTAEFETFANAAQMFLASRNGSLSLYVFQKGEDEERTLQVFDLNGEPAESGKFDGGFATEWKQGTAEAPLEGVNTASSVTTTWQLTDPSSFMLSTGKNGPAAEYEIGEKGLPKKK